MTSLRLCVSIVVGAVLWSSGCSEQVQRAPSMPAPVEVAVADSGFADAPSLARAADGSYFVAWLSFRNGRDTLQVANYIRDTTGFARTGAWEADSGEAGTLLGPKVVAAGDRAFIVYAADHSSNWDIYAVEVTVDGASRPIRISQHPAADIHPDAVFRDNRLEIVWESARDGQRQVMFNWLVDGNVQIPEKVSGDGSAYTPTITHGRTNDLSIAWEEWRDSNFDIYFRQRPPSGRWSFERRLTTSPGIDRNPRLAVQEDSIWLLYEHANSDGERIGSTVNRRLYAVRVTDAGLRGVQGFSPSPIEQGAEAGDFAVDPTGRLWFTYRTPTAAQQGGWNAYFTGYTGHSWIEPSRVGGGKGMDRVSQIALGDGEAVVVTQSDTLPELDGTFDPSATAGAASTIELSIIDLSTAAPAPQFLPLENYQEPPEPYPAAAMIPANGENAPTASYEYDGANLSAFYGDLHVHTDTSICERRSDGSPDEAFRLRRDAGHLDFAAITDHDLNLNGYLWGRAAAAVRTNEDLGRFLPLLGFEWTSGLAIAPGSGPTYGHRNVIYATGSAPRWIDGWNGQTPAQLFAALERNGGMAIPHQLADTGDGAVDWTGADTRVQPAAEIYQNRGSYEAYGAPRQAEGAAQSPGSYLQDAWSRGLKIGVTASPGHGGGPAKTGVWAQSLTRSDLLNAIRMRHTFATTGARIMMDVRINGRLMGEVAPREAGPVSIAVRLRCPGDMASVEILRNNEVVHSVSSGGLAADVSYQDPNPPAGLLYYYVRVTQANGERAWSSPVWIE